MHWVSSGEQLILHLKQLDKYIREEEQLLVRYQRNATITDAVFNDEVIMFFYHFGGMGETFLGCLSWIKFEDKTRRPGPGINVKTAH